MLGESIFWKYFLKVFETLTWQKCTRTTFNNIILGTFLLMFGESIFWKYFLKVFENLTWQKCTRATFNNIILVTFLLTQGLRRKASHWKKGQGRGVAKKSGKKWHRGDVLIKRCFIYPNIFDIKFYCVREGWYLNLLY